MPEIICFAKRGGWFEKFAPGSPPRHDAQLRLVNAQQAHLRGVVGMSLCTCHIFCSLVLGSHLHNSCVGNNGKRCRGCTLGFIGCARRVLRQGADTQLPLRQHWELNNNIGRQKAGQPGAEEVLVPVQCGSRRPPSAKTRSHLARSERHSPRSPVPSFAWKSPLLM